MRTSGKGMPEVWRKERKNSSGVNRKKTVKGGKGKRGHHWKGKGGKSVRNCWSGGVYFSRRDEKGTHIGPVRQSQLAWKKTQRGIKRAGVSVGGGKISNLSPGSYRGEGRK